MKKTSLRMILALSCLVFLALGVMSAALGPILPELARQTGSDLAAVGSVFTGLFLGALLSQLISGPIIDRVGQHAVVLGGMFLLAGGTFAITWSHSLVLMLAMAFVAGLGHGAVDLGINLWIATGYNGRSVSALNLLNFFFGVGAIAGPTVASFSMRLMNSGLPSLWLSAAMLVILLPFFYFLKDGQIRRAAADTPAGQPAVRIYRAPLLWGLGAIVLLYVGLENGMGGWITTYTEQTLQISIETAALVSAGFWLALTAGRMVSAGLGLRISPENLLTASLAGATAGGLLLLAGQGNNVLTAAGVLLIGFCYGPMYPTMMAITAAAFPSGPGKAVSISAACGSLGGMALPLMQGFLLTRVGPTSSAAFTLVGSSAMLLLAVLILLRRKTAPEQAALPN